MDLKVLALARNYTDRKSAPIRKIPVSTPVEFNWKDHPLKDKIFTDGQGIFWLENWNIKDYAPTGVTYYVDPSNVTGNANDNNSGLTPDEPLERPNQAIIKSNVDVIEVMSDAPRNRIFGSQTLTRDLTIKAYNGRDIVIGADETGVSWTKTEGQTNVYQTSVGTVYDVVDRSVLDGEGDWTKFVNVESTTKVNSTPASWYQTEGTLYIHTPDSRPADGDVKVLLNVALIDFTYDDDATLFLEGIKFYGGRTVQVKSSTDQVKFYAKDCEFNFGNFQQGNGLAIQGQVQPVSQNCISAKNYNDGFNYGWLSGSGIPEAVEIECIGRNNGDNGESENGSTMHNGGKIIRVNCAHYRNKGPNINDVHPFTRSWNMGCIAFESTAETSVQSVDFRVNQQGTSSDEPLMWLDYCNAYGSIYSLEAREYSALYVRCVNFQTELIDENGTKEFY